LQNAGAESAVSVGDHLGTAVANSQQSQGEPIVLDVIFVVLTLALFALAWAYVRACDRL